MIELSPTLKRIQALVDTGECLTEGMLDWNNAITFAPAPNLAEYASSPLVDALHSDEELRFGHGSKSLGIFSPDTYSIANAFPYVMLYRMIFKRAGETMLRLPAQLAGLAPVVKAFAREESVCSPYYLNKVGYLICRKLPIEAGIKLLAQDTWHVHRATQEKFPERMAEVLRLAPEYVRGFSDTLSPNMIVHECIIADKVPPKLQARPNPSRKPLHPKWTGDGHFIETPPLYCVQAKDFEAIAGTSLTFHAASQPSVSLVGQSRDFTFLGFAATHDVEAHFRFDSGL